MYHSKVFGLRSANNGQHPKPSVQDSDMLRYGSYKDLSGQCEEET